MVEEFDYSQEPQGKYVLRKEFPDRILPNNTSILYEMHDSEWYLPITEIVRQD